MNAERFARSDTASPCPEMPADLFIESLRELVKADEVWVPTGDGEAFYFRPSRSQPEAYLGIAPPENVQYHVIGSPAGNYFAPPNP